MNRSRSNQAYWVDRPHIGCDHSHRSQEAIIKIASSILEKRWPPVTLQRPSIPFPSSCVSSSGTSHIALHHPKTNQASFSLRDTAAPPSTMALSLWFNSKPALTSIPEKPTNMKFDLESFKSVTFYWWTVLLITLQRIQRSQRNQRPQALNCYLYRQLQD